MTEPLIILAPMRSYSTVVTAMLGQHPEMYSLLETHLFTCDTMQEWWTTFGNTVFAHGLLRSIAQLIMGRQSESTVAWARLWILRRLGWSSAEVFRVLARQVDPSVLIDKSPFIINRLEHLQRALAMFPRARFIHLTRHPLAYGRSFLKFFEDIMTRNPLAYGKSSFLKFFEDMGTPVAMDPQILWHRQHSTILNFLDTVSSRQQMRVRGEDLLAAPDQQLTRIANWIGVQSDPVAVNSMKHPEDWPFACFGPRNALFGGDPNFFCDPRLHSVRVPTLKLDGLLPWRTDGVGFTASVRELGRQLGYA